MPQIIIEQPLLDKLAPQIFDGAFNLRFWTDPEGRKTGAYYLFHDGQWFSDLKHLLGWSRECIHSLEASTWMKHLFRPKSLKPKWLFGHAFEWMNDGTYRTSGIPGRYPINDFLSRAVALQTMLESADIHIDQWGSSKHEEWHEAIGKEIDRKCHPGLNPAGWQMLRDIREGKKDIEFHTMLSNWGNAHYHPMYPIRGPVMASGIAQVNANSILNAQMQGIAFTGPATYYFNLRSSTPTDTSTGTIAAYTSYAAIAVTASATVFPNAAAGVISGQNVNTTWPTNTGSTETEVAMTMDTSAAGTTNLLWGTFASQAIANGNTPQANINAISVSAV